MNFIHYEFDAGPGQNVQITLDKQANVRLLDPTNFNSYRNGQKHTYYGGLATRSPVTISIPHQGHWHVVIDLGGNAGTVRASINLFIHASGPQPRPQSMNV